VPVLPLIDLLILTGWTSLGIGAVLKAIAMTTVYRPTLLTLTSIDFVVVTAICFGFALTLAARSWVSLNEPRLIQLNHRKAQAKALRHAQEQEFDEAALLPHLHLEEPASGSH
jgi:hypothetical protein